MSTAVGRTLQRVIRGRTDSRLRASWRVLVPLVTFVLAMVGMATALLGVPSLHSRPTAVRALRAVGFLATTAVLLGLSARLLDRRALPAYGFDLDRRWWQDFAGALAIGVLAPGLMAAGHLAFGWASVVEVVSLSEGSFVVAMAVTLLFYVGVGLAEEVLFRGIFLLNAIEGLGNRLSSPQTTVLLAWLGTSLVFGAFHVRNAFAGEGVAVVAYLVSVTILGLAFGLAYVLTGSLALPVGLHVATNFARSAVFGSTAPPGDTYPALLRLEVGFSGVWHTLHGLELFYSASLVVFVLAWVSLTRGTVAIDDSLLDAAAQGKRPASDR